MDLLNLPIETVVNIAVQLWDIIGVPALLGVVATWIVQKFKLNPSIPLIESGNKWIVRGFVIIVGTILQLAFFLIAGKEVSWEIVQEIAVTYLTTSAAYTHLFKVTSPNA